MALNYPHKRARASAPVSPEFTYLPTDPQVVDQQVPSEQLVVPHGHSSGFEVYHDNSQEHLYKRRRLGDSFEMPPQAYEPLTSVQGYQDQEKIPVADGYDQQNQNGHDASSFVPRWAAPAVIDAQSLSYPFTRMAELLYPCCNIGWEHLGGYQPLPEAPEVVYEPPQPFMMEALPPLPPPMTAQAIQPLHPAPGSQESDRHVSFPGDQSDQTMPPFANYPVLDQLPLQHLLPMNANEGYYQPAQTDYEYYPNQVIEPDEHHLTMPPMTSFMNSDSLPMQYAPAPYHLPDYPPLLNNDISSSGMHDQYTIASVNGLPHSAPSKSWGNATGQGQVSNFDILLPNQRGGKRGPFRDQTLREQTAQTRKSGSCVRCRMQRIRCENNPDEPGGCCLTCKKVEHTKAGRFPCLRYKITDIRLYKPGPVPGYEWTRRWTNNISDPIQKWASPEVKVIRICEGFSQKCIEFRVREFVPQEGDKLHRTWDYHGTKKSVAIPPYALTDLEDGKSVYTSHIRDSMGDILRTMLGQCEGLLYKTYLQTWQMWRDPSTSPEALELLNWTLRLWVSVRLSTSSGFIVGEETLGMPNDILDKTSPNTGKIPVPPVLGAQMDLILIHHIQTKLRRELLDRLQKMILKNKQSYWLVTYLVTFILLHNAAMITAHDAGYARKHGMKVSFEHGPAIIPIPSWVGTWERGASQFRV